LCRVTLTRGFWLGPSFTVNFPQGGGGFSQFADKPLIQTLTVMITVLAGLGVLNSVLMATRERVHDLGIYKALGMSPCQTTAMLSCWVIAPAIAAAAVAIPAAIIANALTMQAIGRVAGTGIPPASSQSTGQASSPWSPLPP